MAYTGQTISNPITGERITFLKTARETQGQLLVFDCRVTPGGSALPPHVHTRQVERLTVLFGVLGVRRGSETFTLRPGQGIVPPPQVAHQWWNAGEGDMRMRVEVMPAGNLEDVLEALCALAAEGATSRDGMPRDPFHLATLARSSETYHPGVPVWMQKSILRLASPVAWLLGYDRDFATYRTPGTWPEGRVSSRQDSCR
ncbi:MAG: cupin domain-containing protein [Chloroflexi bacterium]|nr:cupin domain-containing protein [Chloroflexota bacterium]